MKIKKNKVVTLTYDLRTEGFESNIVESATLEHPLQFIYDNGMMLPAFEEQLAEKEKGDTFQFMLKPEDAYGIVVEENIIDLPKSSFEKEGKIEDGLLNIGNVISMQDNQGNKFDGVVRDIAGENVKMDFNHPMAGRNLFFIGEVVEVRDATPEELDHGHIH